MEAEIGGGRGDAKGISVERKFVAGAGSIGVGGEAAVGGIVPVEGNG